MAGDDRGGNMPPLPLAAGDVAATWQVTWRQHAAIAIGGR
jgi:hypothetical protein